MREGREGGKEGFGLGVVCVLVSTF